MDWEERGRHGLERFLMIRAGRADVQSDLFCDIQYIKAKGLFTPHFSFCTSASAFSDSAFICCHQHLLSGLIWLIVLCCSGATMFQRLAAGWGGRRECSTHNCRDLFSVFYPSSREANVIVTPFICKEHFVVLYVNIVSYLIQTGCSYLIK